MADNKDTLQPFFFRLLCSQGNTMDKKLICGIQQIGIGVPDVEKAWAWYRRCFGMDVPVFQDAGEAPFMLDYTGGTVQSRTATLAINLTGGGGFEIWQYTSRTPSGPSFEPSIGDYGIFCARIKSRDVKAAREYFAQSGIETIHPLVRNPAGKEQFFLADPQGNFFQIVEGREWFQKGTYPTGGPAGCMIGVSNIEKARTLYSDILGYDTVLYDEEGKFDDFQGVPGGDKKFRRVLLTHSEERKGSFSRLFGTTCIELVSVKNRKAKKIFQERYWGDLGFIHLCFDVKGMDLLKKECEEKSFPFTVDSKDAFDMGQAAGRFSYTEDPDGTLIEFVETDKIPIVKGLGWYLNVGKKDPEKRLPDWIIKALRFNRIKG